MLLYYIPDINVVDVQLKHRFGVVGCVKMGSNSRGLSLLVRRIERIKELGVTAERDERRND